MLITGGMACDMPSSQARSAFCFSLLPEMETMTAGVWSPASSDLQGPCLFLQTPQESARGSLEGSGLHGPRGRAVPGRAHSLACHIHSDFYTRKYPGLAFSGFHVQGLREKSPFVFPRPFLQAQIPDPLASMSSLSPQTLPAGATFMLSLFSCSRWFENL